MTMLRIVAGRGEASPADILQLSMRLATAAAELGLCVVSNKASRSPRSPSRYLSLRDCGDRLWLVRVSNHRMPVRTSHPVPHLDFVSIDGVGGLNEAMVFLHRVAMGRAIWADPADPTRRAQLKRTRARRRA